MFGSRGRPSLPTIPKGEIVATFETYPEALAAVDLLAKADFPVAKLAIIGNDLTSVERVTGKLTYGRAALGGAASGAWLGVFLGLLLIIFSPTTSFAFLVAAVLIGAGFGMLFGLASYAISRRRRDFTSTMQVIATSYAILADPEVVNRARNLLPGGGGSWPGSGSPVGPSDGSADAPTAAPADIPGSTAPVDGGPEARA